MAHTTVLLQKTIDLLDIKNGEVFVDATVGNGGHSKEACCRASGLTMVCIDADESAIAVAKEKLEDCKSKKIFAVSYFEKIKDVLEENHIHSINKCLFDLGLRSDQIEDPNRGFSFQSEGPLKMTFSKSDDKNVVTAYDVVNDWQEENLADIIYGFGEEKFSRRIAKAIADRREEKPIETTTELAEIVSSAVPFWYRRGRIHPATKTFQAIRMAVNKELQQIEKALRDAYEVLEAGGRIAVITFHSLEDRLVKKLFKEFAEKSDAKIITKKPIIPDREEIVNNPRSRSAKLRVIEKL